MTDDTSTAATRLGFMPHLKSRWWTVLLGLSLMANLVVAGVLLGHRFNGGFTDRITHVSYVQMIPRSFFAGLGRERRKELTDIIRIRSKDLRQLREVSSNSPLQLATALEQSTYDPAAVKIAVDAFTTGSGSLAAGGAQVVMEIVEQLTPDERKSLAAAIRQRAENQGRRKRK